MGTQAPLYKRIPVNYRDPFFLACSQLPRQSFPLSVIMMFISFIPAYVATIYYLIFIMTGESFN